MPFFIIYRILFIEIQGVAMTMYNEYGERIQKYDLQKGYLKQIVSYKEIENSRIIRPRDIHYYIKTFYFTDGTHYNTINENDPHIGLIDEYHGSAQYVPQEGEPEKTVFASDWELIEDEPYTGPLPIWDTRCVDEIYILYTQEELNQQKDFEELRKTGMGQIRNLNDSIDDLVLTMADILGGEDIEEFEE